MAFLLYDRWPTKTLQIGHAYPMTQNLPSCPEIPGGVPVLFYKLLRATWVNGQNNLRCHLVTWRGKKNKQLRTLPVKRTVPWRARRGPGAEWAPLSDPDTLVWGESVASGDPPSVWVLSQRWPCRSPLFSIYTHTQGTPSWDTNCTQWALLIPHRCRILNVTINR